MLVLVLVLVLGSSLFRTEHGAKIRIEHEDEHEDEHDQMPGPAADHQSFSS